MYRDVIVMVSVEKEKTTPFGVNLMRSQVLYRTAQVGFSTHWVKISSEARQTAPLKVKQQIVVRTCCCTNATENKVCHVQVMANFSNA